ncbi:sieve element occlusion b [Striga asiatica]|uniref:Sieve element occlusion b n=1 Tax=Striga asiatica TaxID=4170 RepID=A0A5A7RFK2_STRAF|nr:sieve element occlusion b [Striga asiatica]
MSSSLIPALKPHPSMADRRLAPVSTEHKPSYDQLDTPVTDPHKPTGLLAPGRKARDRGVLSSDDNALTKQVLATHAPDMEDLDVRPILAIIEDILRLTRPISAHDSTSSGAEIASHVSPHDEKSLHHSTHRPSDDKVFHTPHLPSADPDAEITHTVTMELLKSLSSYSWDAKAVIVFAAFAINYGEFWLVEQLQTTNPLAKNIAALKDLPSIIDHAGDLKKRFEAVLDLLNQVLRVTHCIIEFKELPHVYISRESPEISAATAHIPTAVYWILRSLLVCASTLLNLIGSGHEYMTSTAESWEILNLAHKLSVIFEHLQNQLRRCSETINKKKAEDAYFAFRKLMESAHIDNMKVLKAMIKSREDQRPLFDGSKRLNERIEALRLKYVLLLISNLELPQEELHILHSIYSQHQMRHEYEVLWLPLVDPTTAQLTPTQETVFYDLRNNMPWHSVDHPSLVEPVAARYIKDVWGFVHTPMLVVLDPQGKPANLDALPMMWIWGSSAFPFTRAREGALWAESTWNIDLLADAIDPRFAEWIRDNKVICLYGGEDIDWIRRFTLSARAAAGALQVPLEMLYVGKRYPKDKVRRCHEVIHREKLSHIFSVDYYDYVWFFWVRLWSMWNSKKQIGMTIDNDLIMQEIMDILAYDSSEQGWAVFSRGNYEITKANGEKVMPVLDGYADWGYKVDHPDKFVPVLDEQLRDFHPEHHCNRLILPGQAGYIPERVVCSECGKLMDKYVMYRCCTD